jgi:hypothetical protein
LELRDAGRALFRMTGQLNEFVVDKQAETWRVAFPW